MERGHECLLVISKKQIDARLMQNYQHMKFVSAPGAPFSLNPLKLPIFFFQQIKLLLFSLRLVKEKTPDAIIAFGGFITGGIALASFICNCPLVLHEANRKPGKAIRFLRGLADRIYLPDGVILPGVHPKLVKHAGFPLRKEIQPVAKKIARERIGVEVEGKLLVVIGGSQGAQSLNEWVIEQNEFLGAEGVNIYCVTGIGKGVDSVSEIKTPDGHTIKAYFTPFTDKMGLVLSSADLVISRAGAGAIAELIHCAVPSILVPYPFAADDHQAANARCLEQHGGCVVVEQTHINRLHHEVIDVIFNDWLLDKFRQNLQRIERGVSAELIAADLELIAINHQNPNKPHRAEAQVPA